MLNLIYIFYAFFNAINLLCLQISNRNTTVNTTNIFILQSADTYIKVHT